MVELRAGMKISLILAWTVRVLRRGWIGNAVKGRNWRPEEEREEENDIAGALDWSRGAIVE